MAIRLFELGIVLRAIDQLSGPLRVATQQVEKLRSAAKSLGGASQDLVTAGAKLVAVGAGLGFTIERLVAPALEAQKSIAELQSTLNLTPGTLKQLDEASTRWATHFVGTSEDFKRASIPMFQAFKSARDAIGATEVAMKLAIATGGDAATSGEVLRQVYETFGDKTRPLIPQFKEFADVLTRTRTQFAIGDVGEFQRGLQQLGPTLGALGVPLSQVVSLLGQAQSVLGSRGGSQLAQVFNEVLGDTKKLSRLGLNIDPGNLFSVFDQIQARIADLSDARKVEFLAGIFGPGEARAVLAVLASLDEVKLKSEAIAKGTRGVDQAAAARLNNFYDQFAILMQSVGEVVQAFGQAAVPTLTAAVETLKPLAMWARAFAATELGQKIGKWVVIIGGLAAVLAIVAGTILVAAGSIGILISGALTAIAVFGGFAIAAAKVILVLAIVGAAVWALVTIWNLLPAMPERMAAAFRAIGGVLLDALLAPVRAVKAVFFDLPALLLRSGAEMISSFAKGILSMAGAPAEALQRVLKTLRSYLPFSPAEQGPLRDLNRIRIVETIAERIQPAPIIARIRRVAAATALAAPLIAGPAPSAFASARAAGSPQVIIQNVTIAPQISIASGGDPRETARALIDALKARNPELARALVQAMELELARKNRTNFE